MYKGLSKVNSKKKLENGQKMQTGISQRENVDNKQIHENLFSIISH